MPPLSRSMLRYKAAALVLAFFALSSQAQDVRVRLLDGQAPAEIALSAHEGVVRLHAGEYADPLLEIAPGEAALISPRDASNELQVSSSDYALYATSLRAEPEDGASFGVEIADGDAGRSPRRYAGKLFISPDRNGRGMEIVNAVPLEAYVASVVSSEYGFDDLEGSKAMAVLARTYALRAADRYGPGYDLLDDTRSQVYLGEEATLPRAREATRDTEGEVLTWRGELVQAVYHASSGGRTADNESVWGTAPVPYLRGKPDPYGRESPHAEWTFRVSRPELLAELGEKFGGEVTGFLLNERNPDGRIASVSLLMRNGRRPVAGNEFRLAVIRRFGARSLRSMRFDARRRGGEYVFTGQGYGHGVGLSQWGARDMAQRGMSYREILDFYYTGVAVSRLDEMEAPPSASTFRNPASAPVETVSETEAQDPPADARPRRQRRRVGW